MAIIRSIYTAYFTVIMLVCTAFVSLVQAKDFVCVTGGYNPVVRSDLKPEELVLSAALLFFGAGGLLIDPLKNDPKGAVQFRVIDTSGKEVPNVKVAAIHKASERFIGIANGNGKSIILPYGDYVFNAVVVGLPLRWGSKAQSFNKKSKSVIDIILDEESPTGTAGITPQSVMGGADFSIGWNGLHPKGATLYFMNTKESKGFSLLSEQNVGGTSGDIKLTAPYMPGKYTISLALCAPSIPLGQWSIDVKRADISIEAVNTIEAGREIVVSVKGIKASLGTLRLMTLSGKNIDTASWHFNAPNDKLFVEAPLQAGNYKLEYEVNGYIFDTKNLAVTPKIYKIETALHTKPGVYVPVILTGSRADDIEFEVWSKTKPYIRLERAIRFGDLRIFGAPGMYEIRMFDIRVSASKMLASAEIILDSGALITNAPLSVTKSEQFTIELPEELNTYDEVGIMPKGSNTLKGQKTYENSKGSKVLTLSAPAKAGEYEIVYYTLSPKIHYKIFAKTPLTVN
jgi:hypothetical protein